MIKPSSERNCQVLDYLERSAPLENMFEEKGGGQKPGETGRVCDGLSRMS